MPTSIDRYGIEVDGKHGFIDRVGAVVIEPVFDGSTGEFSEGLAEVQDGDRWGYIDPAGKWGVPPQYEYAGSFRAGRATVLVDGLWGCIDRSGRMAIAPCSEIGINFSEGLAAICRDQLYGYIDTEGREVIPRRFRTKKRPEGVEARAGRFSEGFAAVVDDESGLSGLIDRSGVFVLSPRYTGVSPLSAGLMVVREGDGLCRYVDVQGRDACGGRRFRESFCFSEGLASADSSVEGEGWGFIDVHGRWVIPPTLDWALSFYEGVAPFVPTANGGFGYIDRFGRITIALDPSLTMACEFRNGIAPVAIGDGETQRWGYIDRTGRRVWEPTR